MPDIWLINGLPGVGKSTTADALAKRFERGVHIEGDVLHKMIVSGAVAPGREPREESGRQIDLTVSHQCMLAASFAEAGFVTVVEHVVAGRSSLEKYRQPLQGFSIGFVTLAPGIEISLERRSPDRFMAQIFTELDGMMRSELSQVGYWIDNSAIGVEETVDRILANSAVASI